MIHIIIHVVRPGDSIYSISRRYGVPAQTIITDNGLTNPSQLAVGQTLVIRTDNIRHTVAPGQSLYSIARDYGVTVNDILRANPQITNPSLITVGQILEIPARNVRHTVTSGQSLYSIARDYGVTVNDILRANPQITDPSRIQVGQVINIPAKKLGDILVNGYAFPSISSDVLQKTLPYLSYLSIFSYEVRPDGSLSTINDTPLIQAARAANVAPMMVITNIAEGGTFNSALANTILTNETVQNTLLDNVVRVMREKNYFGLDIDFEYVYPRDRENYNSFLRKTAERIKPLGYTLTTALAPKLSAAQPGLLYEAHDYPVHGRYADHVILMTYEWGYTYGPAQAVSPINQVKRVLDYAVTAIPSSKILMGMPNYGYDWTLPFVRGSAARSLSNMGAVEQAYRVGANIQYNATSQAPFYNYYDSAGKQHVVWFDDARSIQARLKLVDEYNLGGVSYWTINRFFPQNWLILDSMYNIRKVL